MLETIVIDVIFNQQKVLDLEEVDKHTENFKITEDLWNTTTNLTS